jgi:hypothetical protein
VRGLSVTVPHQHESNARCVWGYACATKTNEDTYNGQDFEAREHAVQPHVLLSVFQEPGMAEERGERRKPGMDPGGVVHRLALSL